MKGATHSPTRILILAPVLTIVVLLALGVTAHGQRNIQGRDLSTAERDISSLENASRKTKRDAQTILAEVNEDFERLRAINEDLKTAGAPTAPLSYKALSDSALEIKKRGSRLRSNLSALPKGEKEEKLKTAVPLDASEMKGLIAMTTDALTNFLTNPVFSDMGTLDNQLALKARRDLEQVIGLSDVLKSGADKLIKQKPSASQ